MVFAMADKAAPASKPSVNPQIAISKPPIVAEEPLHAEIKSFLDAVRHRRVRLFPLEEGREGAALGLEILRSIGEHSSRLELR